MNRPCVDKNSLKATEAQFRTHQFRSPSLGPCHIRGSNGPNECVLYVAPRISAERVLACCFGFNLKQGSDGCHPYPLR